MRGATKSTYAALVAGLAITGLVSGTTMAADGPAVAAKAKKSHAITFTGKGYFKGNTVYGNITKGTYGTGTYKGTLQLPSIKATFKFKGGSFVVTAKNTAPAGNVGSGPWTVSGGTGKFKGVTGKGTWKSPALAPQPTTTIYKGIVKF